MSQPLIIMHQKSIEVQYLRVCAKPRYWGDAVINGQKDVNGDLTPLRVGNCWCPTINIQTGEVLNWPQGTTADIHFKVCDQGEYWLQDAEFKDVAKWAGIYVPNEFLCVGANGYGDYNIILTVGADGKIKDWGTPGFDSSEWDLHVLLF